MTEITIPILIILICYCGKKLDEILEIKRLIKEGKEMEKEVIVDVRYEIIN